MKNLAKKDHAKLLSPLIVSSVQAAAKSGASLALIRPRNARFFYKIKDAVAIENERDAYRRAARQTSFLDKDLEALEPTPYVFRFKFEDSEDKHDYVNSDWESHAMFYRNRQEGRSDAEILERMMYVFNDEYPKKGMAFAVGNMAKRPQTWQLLGVIRLDDVDELERDQLSLF